MSKILHVLLTGGVGSRLWPLSRISRPKQYLNIFGPYSLFELAIKRNIAFSDELIVVGNQENRDLSEASMNKLEVEDYIHIVEATPRNTAPAIAFAAFAAQPEDILLITPADHIIKEGPEYATAIREAISLAKEDHLVTFGIRPLRPETGFGYIESDGNEVLSFREKPDVETARSFQNQGNFYWNSGMFCFKAGIYLEELKKYSPEVYQKSFEAWKASIDHKLGFAASVEIPSISVDYAVMEKSKKIKIVKAGFDWSDMGSFESVYTYLKEQGHPVDAHGNMQIGTQKHTVFVGLKNCILVQTKDANLVLAKEASQEVKKVFQDLEKNNSALLN